MKKYYARFIEVENEIAIFATEAARNNWVNFMDEFSTAVGATAENATFQRMALTEAEAEEIAGDMLRMSEVYTEDGALKGVYWLTV